MHPGDAEAAGSAGVENGVVRGGGREGKGDGLDEPLAGAELSVERGTGGREVESQDALELAVGEARSSDGEGPGSAVIIAGEVGGRAGGDEGVGRGVEGEGGGVSRQREEQGNRGGHRELAGRF